MTCVTRAMMLNLIDACKDKRLRSSSSHSVYIHPTTRVVDEHKLYVAAGNIQCFISEGVVVSLPPLSATAIVKGSLIGENGVWLSISSGKFWLDIHVPTLTERQLQTRQQRS
jgi:hypothetical protein